MAAIADFQPFILPEVSGCPDVMVDQAAVKAAIQFCGGSRCWQYEHVSITTTANIDTYALTLPTGSQIETILSPGKHGENKVHHRAKKWLDDNVTDWQTITGEYVEYVTVLTPGEIRVVPIPDITKTDSLMLTLALKPLPTATTIPDQIFNEYCHAIADGAKSFLMDQPGKAWSNPAQAKYLMSAFLSAIESAKVKARGGFSTERNSGRTTPLFIGGR